MKDPHDIIIKPVLSEKSYDEMPEKKYAFIVDAKANKSEIKKAVEVIFGVKVERVNTLRQQGKLKRVGVHTGRKPSFKKAYIKLTEESKEIKFFEGMAQ